ncbi:MAG: hypothetical protein CVV27_01755 [Candidatus Melainabacteria bacterium HGW-Melainabacteria-1]|nr:MAG: hypothetical protein CVV27_01755 [Candidatus Melainabacteria bacterium HGW-Melainabacteria-1]
MLLLGLMLLSGCKQAIVIPEQNYLLAMGTLNACWRNDDGAARCNCAVEKMREQYPSASLLEQDMNDPATRSRAISVIASAKSSCGL